MTYARAIDFLFHLEHGSVKLGLERIASAVAARRHPERRYPTIHVAGTNGKGSTCALLAAILESAGERTGLLTSPHLTDFCERIRVGGRMVSRREVADLTEELRPLILDLKLSFFEASTLLAFEIFARRRVDCAVIEVGMGGRLDATNVVAPELTIVTGIDYDHVQSLGRTLPAIAREKAGILKSGVPLLLGPCSRSVEGVFRRRAEELGVPLERVSDRVRAGGIDPLPAGTRFEWLRRDGATGRHSIRLRGVHQVANALLAAEAARELARLGLRRRARALSEEAIRSGLARGRWPGRCETLPRRPGEPPVVIDVAHNRQGARVLRETWEGWLAGAGSPALAVGMLGDKDQEGFLRELRGLSKELLLVPLDSPRAGPLEPLIETGRRLGFRVRACGGMEELWRRKPARRPLLVAGSFLTVDAALQWLRIGPVRTLFPAARPTQAGAGRRGVRHARA